MFVYVSFCVQMLCLIFVCGLSADTIELKNGDRLSGRIVRDGAKEVHLQSDVLGLLKIPQAQVQAKIVDSQPQPKPPVAAEPEVVKGPWTGNFAAGYDFTDGNTEDSEISLEFELDRKYEQKGQLSLDGQVYYSSTNGDMDEQIWEFDARYDFKLHEDRWFNFVQYETEHDRFANINFRHIPSVGTGYWFLKKPNWKAKAEVALGYEMTDFRDNTPDDEQIILIPRAYMEAKLFERSVFKQEIIYFPGLDQDVDGYRLEYNASLTTPISERLSLRLSLKDEYDSDPPASTENNDIRLTSSLVYSF